MKNILKKYENWLLAPVDGRPVSIFRILFGIFIIFDAWFFQTFLDHYWPSQTYHFQFPVFAGWPYFNHEINTGLLISTAVAGVFIAIGYRVRWAAAWVAIMVSHLLLMEASFYLNHLILTLIIAVAFIFVPVDRHYALRKSKAENGSHTVCRYELFSIIIPFWMSYTYSAVEKMRSEWLNGDIIAANMGLKRDSNPIASWLYHSQYLSGQAWTVMLIELLTPFLLAYRRTRLPTVVALILFHFVNHVTLDIGLFSFLMFASLILYWKMDGTARDAS